MSSREDISVAFAFGFRFPWSTFTALLSVAAVGVCWMVAGTMTSRLNRDTTTHQISLQLIQQLDSMMDQHRGGDIQSPSLPSLFVAHDEIDLPQPEASVSGPPLVGFAVALKVLVVLAVAAIGFRFRSRRRGTVESFQNSKPSVKNHKSFSNRSSVRRTPSKVSSDDYYHASGPDRKRRRIQLGTSDEPVMTNTTTTTTTTTNPPPAAPSVPSHSQTLPTACVHPYRDIMLPQHTSRMPPLPQKDTSTTIPLAALYPSPVSISRNAIHAAMTSAAPTQYHEKVDALSKNEARNSSNRQRLAFENMQQTANKAVQAPAAAKDASAETTTKRVSKSTTSTTVNKAQRPTAVSTKPNGVPRKAEKLQDIRARVREQFSNSITPSSTHMTATSSSSNQEPPTARSSSQIKTQSPSPTKKPSHKVSAKQVKLQEARARVRENKHLIPL